MSTNSPFEEFAADLYALKEKQAAIQNQIQELRASLIEAQPEEWETKILKIISLEREAKELASIESERKAQAEKLKLKQQLENLAAGQKALAEAEEKEKQLLDEIDRMMPSILKIGKDLLELRQTTESLTSSVQEIKNNSESKVFFKRRKLLGQVGWEVKRFFVFYEIMRGRRTPFEPPPEW